MPNDIKKEIINSLHLKNSFKMDKIVAVKTGTKCFGLENNCRKRTLCLTQKVLFL